MTYSRLRVLILGLTLIVLMITFIGCSADDDSYSMSDEMYSSSSSLGIEKYCYPIPASYWPRIQSGGIATAILVFVTFIVGCVIYVIGYFAGVRVNRRKAIGTISITVFIGIFSRSLEVFLRYYFTMWLAKMINNQIIAAMAVDFVLYVAWITFIAGIAVHLYETFVITAAETFGRG